MTGIQRSALIATLVKEYRAANHFCGETHVQKSVYFMQELFNVPLAFEYLLYKYGPFSFELQGHLAAMRADDMLIVRPHEYGSTFEPGEQVAYLEQHLPNTIRTYHEAVRFDVDHLAILGVKQLEALATALYFTVREQNQAVDARAAKICDVKPHISIDDARKAIQQIDRWREELSPPPSS